MLNIAIRGICLVIFTLMYLNAQAFELQEKDYSSIKGAQVFVLAEEPDIFFAALKEKGINTVFFRVFHNKSDRSHLSLANPCPDGGVYFGSVTACVVNPLLEDVVNAAHRQGIELYAWMATRSLSFLKTPENMSQSFSSSGKTVAGYGASIFREEVRTSITALFREIALTGVDGILIQDDFIMKYNEGAEACGLYEKYSSKECRREAFFNISSKGSLIPIESQFRAWSAWKAASLSRFFWELRRDVRLIAPELKWALNIYYESPVYPDRGLSWYSHSMDSFLEAGVDYLAVMAYQEQIASELSLDGESLLSFAADLTDSSLLVIDDPDRIIFKVQTKPFYGGKLTGRMRQSFYERIHEHGGQSFVELPINAAEDLAREY